MTLEQHQTAEATESQARFSAEEVREILSIASELQDSTLSAEQLREIARDSGIADENLERAIELYRQRRSVEEQRKRKATVRKQLLTLTATVLAATIGVAVMLTYTAAQVEHATTKVNRHLLAASPTCSVYMEARESRHSPRDKRLIIQRSNGYVFVLDHSFGDIGFASISPSGKYVVFEDWGGVYVVTLKEESYRIRTLASRLGRNSYGTTSSHLYGSFFAGWTTKDGKEAIVLCSKDGRTEVKLPVE